MHHGRHSATRLVPAARGLTTPARARIPSHCPVPCGQPRRPVPSVGIDTKPGAHAAREGGTP